jgi:hypothetical protein
MNLSVFYAVEIKELQNLRVCYVVHRHQGLKELPLPPAALIAKTQAARDRKKTMLNAFTWKPSGMVGAQLFRHQCKHRNQWKSDPTGKIAPSAYLDVECSHQH